MTDAPFTVETFTAGDGYRWRFRRYPARGAPKARVVCLHGIQSHAGWYDGSCRFLAGAGYAVDFLDRRGSGMNDEARGDTPGFRRLLDDIGEFLRHVRADAPLPVVLLAISWGGKLAVGAQWRYPGLIDSLALLCPGLVPRVTPTFDQRRAVLWSRLVRPRRLFPIPLDEPELFTATPRWQQFLRGDPLTLRRVTARFALENARLDYYLLLARRAVKVPTLLMLAGQDRIIDNARTRAYVARFRRRLVIEYPAAHHTLEFEPEPAPHLGDLLWWLERGRHALDRPLASI